MSQSGAAPTTGALTTGGVCINGRERSELRTRAPARRGRRRRPPALASCISTSPTASDLHALATRARLLAAGSRGVSGDMRRSGNRVGGGGRATVHTGPARVFWPSTMSGTSGRARATGASVRGGGGGSCETSTGASRACTPERGIGRAGGGGGGGGKHCSSGSPRAVVALGLSRGGGGGGAHGVQIDPPQWLPTQSLAPALHWLAAPVLLCHVAPATRGGVPWRSSGELNAQGTGSSGDSLSRDTARAVHSGCALAACSRSLCALRGELGLPCGGS